MLWHEGASACWRRQAACWRMAEAVSRPLDMAMQLLGNLFEYVLEKRGQAINILGATSGDTGSAAEYAMRGKHNVNVFML